MAAELLTRQEQFDVRVLRTLNSDADEDVSRLIGRCLAFDPDKRWSSAEEFAAELGRELQPQRLSRR